jgi:hypothetical protein
MIVITSNYLTKEELALVRKYCRFVLNKFVRQGTQRKSKVNVKVLGPEEIKEAADAIDLDDFKAWCTYDGIDETGSKRFTVIIDYKRLNKKAKKVHVRLKNILIDLGHELVHVKQYLNNEIFDYKNGDVRFKGTLYDASHYLDEEKYYDSPWEIESYGRENGLYKMFCTKLKQEKINRR